MKIAVVVITFKEQLSPLQVTSNVNLWFAVVKKEFDVAVEDELIEQCKTYLLSEKPSIFSLKGTVFYVPENIMECMRTNKMETN